ncbi:pyridoxamine 5'-phosphate oxidase family protein [Haloplanus rubicundus]|uniref:Pyridoxamine 5'-phosphate oxidase family protein n=1 Tax=Haloplanus rubicundus TaxID=1547898 RepID=A0A345DYF5_9EURY|nr:pyridoxamine 5'-phosphate oxidase family protein [Haloplanus rubicundus]AXG04977.1 pyridoxamine 5'-phosphate oxidase family protein [Haloplanus rubicundus]
MGVTDAAVSDAVYGSLTAEFATAKGDRPMTVPLTPFYDPTREVVVATAAPAFAGKAERAAANPRVSLLLHGDDGRLHLTGRAAVRDGDPEANAAVVERLLRDEPPSPKRAAMTAAADFLDTRLGLLTLDWYGLRILIEIEPTGVERCPVDDVGATVPAWPAGDVDAGEAATYDRAVATLVQDGWPRSWPLAIPTVRDGRLRLSPPPGVSPADGQPACVLLHWHDDDLSSLEQRVVRGRCRIEGGDAWFDPASSVHLRNRSVRDRLRFVVDGKRRTRTYFAERGERYSPWPGLRTLVEW